MDKTCNQGQKKLQMHGSLLCLLSIKQPTGGPFLIVKNEDGKATFTTYGQNHKGRQRFPFCDGRRIRTFGRGRSRQLYDR